MRAIVLCLSIFCSVTVFAKGVDGQVKCEGLDLEGFHPLSTVGKCMQLYCWTATKCMETILGSKTDPKVPDPIRQALAMSPSCKDYHAKHKGSTCKGKDVATCVQAEASNIGTVTDCAKVLAMSEKFNTIRSAQLKSLGPANTADDAGASK